MCLLSDVCTMNVFNVLVIVFKLELLDLGSSVSIVCLPPKCENIGSVTSIDIKAEHGGMHLKPRHRVQRDKWIPRAHCGNQCG